MPIKFRCVHCNKLLGIARRKAGTIVDCPQCKQQLIVPAPEEPEPEPEDDQPTLQPELPKPNRLFEQDNFEAVFREQEAATYRQHEVPDTVAPSPTPFAAERNLPVPAPVPAPVYPTSAGYPFPTDAPPRPAGLVLSGSKIMILLIVLFFVLAGAFGAGVVVGKSLSTPATPKATE